MEAARAGEQGRGFAVVAALVAQASAAAQSLQQEAAELARAVGILRLDARLRPSLPLRRAR